MLAQRLLDATREYWNDWVRSLAVPFEWQEAVIRAAITLKLCSYEDTGAIIAAITTSIPESANSGRNWDYRFCWIRDTYFTVQALNRLGATRTMEGYLRFIQNLTATPPLRLQPVLWHRRRLRARGDDRAAPGGLSRHGTGAGRQCRLRAGAARRLRRSDPAGDAELLR